jgi:hypothetical protein
VSIQTQIAHLYRVCPGNLSGLGPCFADIIKEYSELKTIKNEDFNMKTRKTVFFILITVVLGIVFLGQISTGSSERVGSSREYEVTVVGEAKSDTQRIIEAYERLSDQYLSLVQNQLVLMATNDRDVQTRLERIEKKLDDLSVKIDAMQKTTPPPAIKPVGVPVAPVQPLPQVSGPAHNPAVVK